jgi:enoyl-CoA hydratase/carnithine racemase
MNHDEANRMTDDAAREFQDIRYRVADRIATITLHRPDHLNAVTERMRDELIAAFDRVDADPDVGAVVVTGAGRAFCAGADVSGGAKTFDPLERGWAEEVEDFRDGGGLIALRIFACTKPVIAAVNGVAAGLGATMLLPMDIRVASATARFGFVFSRRGIVPEACATWFLPRVVGINRALEWAMTGRVFPATEAIDAGLVRSVHDDADLLSAAYALAREIIDNAAPVAVAMIRQMMWRLLGAAGPMDAHRVDSKINFYLGRSADVAEGIDAFLRKRPPIFPMRMPADAPASYPWWQEPDFRASR